MTNKRAPVSITLQGQKVLGLGTTHPSWQQPSSSIQNRSNRKKVRSELFRCQRKKMSLSENFCRLSFFWRIGRNLGFYPDSSFGIDSICIRCRFDPREKKRYCSCQPIFGSRGGFGFRAFRRHTQNEKKMFRTKNDLIWSHSSEWKENNLCVQSYSNDPDLDMKPMIMTIWRKFTLFRSECSTGTTLAEQML